MPPPQVFLNNSGFPWEFRDALCPIPRGTQSAHLGGLPIKTLLAVTLWVTSRTDVRRNNFI